MEDHEELLDIDMENIAADLMDIKERARVELIISKLKMYSNNPQELTKIYTSVLEDDNVSYLLKKLSQNSVFYKHFPEFYVKNKYGEDVINCQQNSSFHKYGVFKHILTTIESVGNPQIPIGKWQRKLLKWTMLLHDIGKPYVKMIMDDGTDSFANHDEKSVELASGILDRFDFSVEEKNIILTLIKYHDRYLNEGEITLDNMKFLAAQLNNSKELFYLLLDVKDSDARAKNVDVYNKFKIVKNKYLEFINTYMGDYAEQTTNNVENQEILSQQITKPEIDILLAEVLNKKKLKALYQHIIDLEKKKVFGYEVFTKLDTNKYLKVVDFINYAQELDKSEKVQQLMMINGIEKFEACGDKEADFLFVNSDIISYQKYINKPRLYDMMEKNKIVLEFQNYEKKDIHSIQEIITAIHKNKGYVALDNFGIGNFGIDDINYLDVDFIVPDKSLIENICNDQEKQKFLSQLVTYSISKNCKVIAIGVEDKDTLDVLIRLGVKYVQGYYFSKPNENFVPLNDKIKDILENKEDDTIN